MASEEGESLESLLNKATSPSNRDEDWEAIMAFCDQINKELEGPQISVRLLAHKIQSPQDREALYALTTLEACVKNCGARFHQEIGKFRFLNELIKVVSPKYLGAHTADKVKQRCIELIYSWSVGLSQETKISEAYQMLKRQGIVKQDPTYIDKKNEDAKNAKSPCGTFWLNETFEPPPPPRTKNTVFEDEEKSKLLARLLRSKHPEDLQAANRLIKNMVRQDAERMEKVSRRVTELETVNNNVKLLTEMLEHYNAANASPSDKDIMKELYDNLEKTRPNLFRLASDTEDKDNEGINAILKANDEVMKVMTLYKKLVEGITDENGIASVEQGSSLLDLGSGAQGVSPSSHPPETQRSQSTSSSILDDQLLALGLNEEGSMPGATSGVESLDVLGDLFSTQSPASAAPTTGVPVQNLFMNSGLPASAPVQPAVTMVPGGDVFSLPPAQTTASPQPRIPIIPPAGPPTHQVAPAFHPVVPTVPPTSSMFAGAASQPSILHPAPTASPMVQFPTTVPPGGQQQQHQQQQQPCKTALDDLDILGQSLKAANQQPASSSTVAKVPMNQMPKPASPVPGAVPSKIEPVAPSGVTLKSLVGSSGSAAGSQTSSPSSSAASTPKKTPKGPSAEVQPLTDLFVAIESVKPGTVAPVTAYDKNGAKIVIHFGKDTPRPDVLVMVVSVMSTNVEPVKNFVFQAAVPKLMRVKLQPPSATDLPAYNPILPPAAITQVMLIANPHKEKIRLKYKVGFSLGTTQISDVGEVDTFPVQ